MKEMMNGMKHFMLLMRLKNIEIKDISIIKQLFYIVETLNREYLKLNLKNLIYHIRSTEDLLFTNVKKF